MGRSSLKRVRELQRKYPNWTVSISSGNHLKLKHISSGEVLFASLTPSDWRSERNLDSQVRRIEKSEAVT